MSTIVIDKESGSVTLVVPEDLEPDNGVLKYNPTYVAYITKEDMSTLTDNEAKYIEMAKTATRQYNVDMDTLRIKMNEELVANINYLETCIQKKFSELEKKTFEAQKNELMAYKENKDAFTPTIDILAENRGITKEEMVGKIERTMEKYNTLTLAKLGTYQKYRDKMRNAETVEDLLAIKEEIALDNIFREANVEVPERILMETYRPLGL